MAVLAGVASEDLPDFFAFLFAASDAQDGAHLPDLAPVGFLPHFPCAGSAVAPSPPPPSGLLEAPAAPLTRHPPPGDPALPAAARWVTENRNTEGTPLRGGPDVSISVNLFWK